MTKQKKLQFFYITGTAERLRKFVPHAIKKVSEVHNISQQKLMDNVSLEAIFNEVVEMMSDEYTKEEIDAAISFFNSEAGKGIAKKERGVSLKIAQIVVRHTEAAVKKSRQGSFVKN